MRSLENIEQDAVGGGFFNPISIIEHLFDAIESDALRAVTAIGSAAAVKKAVNIIKKFGKHGDDAAKDLEKAAHDGTKVLGKVEDALAKESGKGEPELPPEVWIG